MTDTNEMDDCDLDTLLNLLDDEAEVIEKPKQSTSLSQASSSLSSYKENLKNSDEYSGDLSCSMPNQTVIEDDLLLQSKNEIAVLPIDPLENELLQMEEKMRKLREEISKKKNMRTTDSGSKSFTKLSTVINPNSKSSESVRYLNEKEKSKLLNDLSAKKSEIHSGDTDSEDEEDNRMPLEAQMSSYGREMKKRLAHSANVTKQNLVKSGSSAWKGDQSRSLTPLGKPNLIMEKDQNSTIDSFSGLRIINPLINNNAMKEMMYSRRMIQMSSIVSQLRGGEIEGDWVTIGVIVSKSETKTSQKGTQYCIFQMSDLRDCTKVASVFLFAGAYKNLWKTIVGTVVGILNPQIMKDSNKQTDGRNVITMSVNNHEKVLLMGTSKDLGCCKGRSKQGTACRQFVNKNVCEFCVFHIQSEYKKMNAKTRRPELQSSFARVDPRKALQKKVLGRDQVFYGGQLYNSNESAAPRKKLLPTLKGKDLSALSSLSMKLKAKTLKEQDKKDSFVLQHLTDEQLSTVAQVSKDNEELGQMLLAPSFGARNLLLHKAKDSEIKSKASQNLLQNQQTNFSAKEFLKSTCSVTPKSKSEKLLPKTPELGRGLSPGTSFEIEFPTSKFNSAKEKALAVIKKQGGLASAEKNVVRNKEKASKLEFQSNVKKRIREVGETDEEASPRSKTSKPEDNSEPNKLKLNQRNSLLGSVDVNSEKFLNMIKLKSSHTNLIQTAEDEEVEKYYNTLEKKEILENKMASTMELATSAVICLKCKYKATSAADHCREEKHPLKVIKATKRFFECINCKQRTMSLEKLPMKPCSHCSKASWRRVAMWKERQGPKLDSEILSLRGDELAQISSSSNKLYLNL